MAFPGIKDFLARYQARAASVGADSLGFYTPPFAYSGRVRKALVDISGEAVEDMEAKMKMYLARQ